MREVEILKERLKPGHFERLSSLGNKDILEFVAKYTALCNPASVFVRTDSAEDTEYIRSKAIELKEEHKLKVQGHTAHFDGYYDQARDKKNTKFLVTPDMTLGPRLNSIERNEGLEEIHLLLKDIMKGREMFVLFLCLGPVNSEFSIYAMQLTDSAYVAHSEDILYRPAFSVFEKKGEDIEFFQYVHSAGEVEEESRTSKNVDKRRIYVDFQENTVYSVNTQYAGNTVGFKKLALRLAIRKALKEKWLAEHMFVMGVNGPNQRKSYFLGAFPSMCGKTSTCMVKGENIVGDDLAYLRKREGSIFAVNVERGIFGIIKDVNAKDDPLIWEALTTPGEVIFSNILVKDGIPYWQGDGREMPSEGMNFSGHWYKGKKDAEGKEIPPSHPNARYTIRLSSLKNCDPALEEPQGVKVNGIIYGGRDSDTWPPVFESFDWKHGIVTIGASLESETTAATLGEEGVRKFNIMAILDFLSVPLGKYLSNYLEFGDSLSSQPTIFGVNYFLKGANGEFLTDKQAKRVWLKWMELRTYRDIGAVKTPIGFLPLYEDLKNLFRTVLSQEYTENEYTEQFSLRVPQNLSKIERITSIYKNTENIPGTVLEILLQQKRRLQEAQNKFGDFIPPQKFPAA